MLLYNVESQFSTYFYCVNYNGVRVHRCSKGSGTFGNTSKMQDLIYLCSDFYFFIVFKALIKYLAGEFDNSKLAALQKVLQSEFCVAVREVYEHVYETVDLSGSPEVRANATAKVVTKVSYKYDMSQQFLCLGNCCSFCCQ